MPKKNGFTLIELLTVIGILLVLATIVTSISQQAKARAQKTQCMTNLKNLHTIAFLYFQDYRALPLTNTVSMLAKQQAKDLICPAARGNPSLLPIVANLSIINDLRLFADIPSTDGAPGVMNFPIFSDTSFQLVLESKTVAPHQGSGYAVLTNGKLISFTTDEIKTNSSKFLVTGIGGNVTST